jgi:hypothetical protein
VIDARGERQISDSQVVIWAADKPNPEEKDFRALLVVTTDRSGYFSGLYPVGSFTSANGAIAFGGEIFSEPIHLADDGFFPESLILAVDLGELELESEDCVDCTKTTDTPRDPDNADLTRADGTFSSDPGGGQCVDFTAPDRTLEEFTYSYVVRTSEPEIKGLTLEEPSKVSMAQLEGVLRPILATKTFAINNASEKEEATMVSPLMMRTAGSTTPAIDAKVLKTLARDPDGFSLTSIASAAKLTAHGDLLRLLGKVIRQKPGRGRMTCERPVDWDDEPTIYQACTIAHGHVLRFKQEWVADGYSMGNLVNSLPLAPAQKKQIAIVDWERREQAARTEALRSEEEVSGAISRDRDVNEIVRGALNESVRGGSSSSTGSFGGGLGIAGGIGGLFTGGIGFLGGLLGVGGGTSSASSSAWQNSSRSTSASALNQLRDRTIQSASAVRSQRATVVQTVRQGERVTAQTETIANYNHCHAITVQYFEVLRHMLVRQRLADVQECLFVPLLMSRFDSEKALRWRYSLRRAVRSRRLHRGFDALERIANNYEGSDLPVGSYADQNIDYLDGDLRVRFQLARPRDDQDDFDPGAWVWLGNLLPFINPQEFYDTHLKNQQFKDRVFMEQLGPQIAERFVQLMQFVAVLDDDTEVRLPIDATLLSDFRNDRRMHVSLRLSDELPPLIRRRVKFVAIKGRVEFGPFLIDLLPIGSRVIVESGTLRYRTRHATGYLFRNARILNDIKRFDDARIYTPLNRQELRNPREEDKELGRHLLDHLNEHIERFHHAIWWQMSGDRRYMLLDGFVAPNSGGRSVASVVENELIGIVGNSLVMPVARGYHLDPTFGQNEDDPIDLFEHYQPTTPVDPTRIAIPTRGVYAEAVMGACNSCEFKEEERFWRWEESPIPDSPTAIAPISADSRRADPGDLSAKDLPAPIVNLQNAPAAPDPAGVGAALQLLGASNLFGDVTGLEGTQRNALEALKGALSTAQFFGGEASNLAQTAGNLALQGAMVKDVDKALRTIQKARGDGLISDDAAQSLTKRAIEGMIGSGATGTADKKGNLTDQPEVRKLLESSDDPAEETSVRLARSSGGESETVDVSRKTGGSLLGSLFGAGSGKPATIGKRSTKAEALARIIEGRASTAESPWKLDRATVMDRLENLVKDPNLIDQDSLNLCGPAAFMRLWLARDPQAVVDFGIELYDKGKSKIGSYAVEPGDDSLIAEDYATIAAAAGAGFAPQADWMILGAIRDAENLFFDFEGKPEEDASAGTFPGEVQEWLEATGLYGNVRDEGNFFLTKGLDHALALKPGPSRDVVLLINTHVLKEMNVSTGQKKSDEFFLSAFPNHYVVLSSEIKETADGKVQFDYWSWGQQYSGAVQKATFEANYYGAVIAEGANP